MDILDDRGRLFGRVNVIDALVVLLGVAVVVAGASLALGGGSSAPAEPEPADDRTAEHVTLHLGVHPPYAAALVQPGNATLGGLDGGEVNATVTDVHRSPASNGVLLVAVVEVDGERTADGFRAGGTLLRYGTTVDLSAPDYAIESRVATVGGGPEVETRTVRTTVEANVSAAVADAVSAGDSQRIAGDAVATVESVETVGSNGDRETIRVDLSLETRPVGDAYEYGGRPVAVGTTLGFETSRYAFDGRVVAVEP